MTLIQSLDELSQQYVLDKHISTKWHNYIPVYSSLFEPYRYRALHVLEIGIGVVEQGQMLHRKEHGYVTGNSLRCWRDYFPNSQIYGIDIFETNLNERRIRTFVADQSNGEQLENVMKQIGHGLDIVIDDGSHEGVHQMFSFMYLSKHMVMDSIYVIEDIQQDNQEGFRDLSIFPENFQRHIREHFEYTVFDTGHDSPLHDDFIVAFKRIK